MFWILMILKILKKSKMKFYQMKMTDVARTTESEVVEIELFEIAEIQCFVYPVFRFIVAVILVAHLIDFYFDALIASIAAVSAVDTSIALMWLHVFIFDAVVPKSLMLIKNWFVDCFFDQMFSFSYNAFHFFLTSSRILVTDLMWIVFFRDMRSFFRSFSELIFFRWMHSLKSSLLKFFDSEIFRRFVFEKINEMHWMKILKSI